MNKIRIFVPKKFTKLDLLVDFISLCAKVNINEAQSILKSVDNSPKPFTFDIPFDVGLEDYAKFNTISNKLLNDSNIAWRILPEDIVTKDLKEIKMKKIITLYIPKGYTDKIRIIKLVRDITLKDLKESKDLVDSVFNTSLSYTIKLDFVEKASYTINELEQFTKESNLTFTVDCTDIKDTEFITFPDKLEIDPNMELGIMSEYILVKRTTLTALLKEHDEIVELTHRLQNLYSK